VLPGYNAAFVINLHNTSVEVRRITISTVKCGADKIIVLTKPFTVLPVCKSAKTDENHCCISCS
jgi:hypothetical protein